MTPFALVAGLVLGIGAVELLRIVVVDRIILHTALKDATGDDRVRISRALLQGGFLSAWGRRCLRTRPLGLSDPKTTAWPSKTAG